ncbi:unnamed protein product [Parajaminaea phylloscopi]
MFGGGGNTGFTFGQPAGQQQPQQPQQQTGGLFGNAQQAQPQQNVFGGGSTGFGSSTFGGGQQQQQAGTGGGLFGQNNTQQQTASGGFSFGGQQQPSSGGFGAPKPAGSTFGGFGQSGTAATPGNAGFTFGSNNNNAAPQQQQANAFGAPSQPAAGGLFGAKPATSGGLFGSASQQPASSGLFGQQPQQASGGLFGGNAAGNPAPVTQGSSNPPYQATVLQEKDAANNQGTFAYQSITCMPQYKGMSVEELRVQDYEQGRKSGNAASGNTSTGFGFGQGQTGQPSTGFGGAQSTGAFGQSQQQPATGGLFGSQSGQAGGGIFGGGQQQTQQPASGGLFGQASAQSNNTSSLFGQQPSANSGFAFGGNNQQQQQQQQQPASSGFSFGSANNNAAKPGGLFGGFGGSTQNATPSAGGFSFGQQQQPQQQPAQTAGFGGNSSGFGFGGNNNAQKPGGLFGTSQPAAPSATPAFGGFGSATSGAGAQPSKSTFSFGGATSTSGTGFGAAPAATGGSLFGGQSAQPTTTSQPAAGGSLFGGFGQQSGQQNAQQPQAGQTQTGFGSSAAGGTSLFGGAAATKPGGLFGSTATQNAGQTGFGAGGTSSGFSFGNTANTQQQAKPAGFSFGQSNSGGGAAPSSGLFGGLNSGGGATGGLFGNNAQSGNAGLTGGLFSGTSGANASNTAGSNLFGNSTIGGQQGSLFGSSLGQSQQHQQPNSLHPQGVGLTSDPYGTDALFKSATGGGAVNQPPLPFNVSASASTGHPAANALSASARSKPLPAPMMSPFRPNPRNSHRVMKLRGGTPARELSPFSGPSASLGRGSSPALNGSRSLFSGLSDEVGSPGPDGGLPAQAFVSRPNVKRLIVGDQSNTSWGRSARAGTEDPNISGSGLRDSVFGARSGTVPPRVLPRGAAFSPALESGIGRREQTAGIDESLADQSIPRSRSVLFSETPSKANTQSAKGRDLFASSAAPAPAVEKDIDLSELPEGAYHVSPSLSALRRMGYSSLSRVENFTITRKSYGRVRFLAPVDLTAIQDLALIPGGIVQIREKEIWVYPQQEDLESGLDGMQAGYELNPVPKAKQGSSLNVPAEVQLERCWPLDRASRQPLRDADHPRVKQHVAKLQRKAETHYRDYHAGDGRWTFLVDHFSRYGLDSSDDEDADDRQDTQATRQERTVAEHKSAAAPKHHSDVRTSRRAAERPPSLTSASSSDDGYGDDDHELESQTSSEMHESDLGLEVKESTPRRPNVYHRDRTSGAVRQDSVGVRHDTPLASQQNWAAQTGIEPRRVQVMQASFFGSRAPGEQQPHREELKARTPGMKVGQEQDNISKRKFGQGHGTDGFKNDKAERSTFSQPAAAKDARSRVDQLPQLQEVAQVTSKFTRVGLQNALTKEHEGCYLDAGAAFGRSFRIGWGPGGTIAFHSGIKGVLGGARDRTASADSERDLSVLRMAKFGTFPPIAEADEAAKASELLQIQLEHSQIFSSRDDESCDWSIEEDCPAIAPSTALRFGNFASKFEHSDRSHEALIWRLGKSLFDEIDLKLPAGVSSETVQTVTALRRKEAVSSWLAHAVAGTVEAECRGHRAASRKTALILAHLTGYQVESACCAALDSGDLRLATLLAEAGGGDDEARADIAEQLLIWRTEGIDAHISTEHRRIYEILAGNVTLSAGATNRSIRDPGERVDDLAIAGGLDWKRAFGLHLWYGTSFDTPLTTAFERYEAAVSGTSGGDTAPPLPPYREKAGLGSLRLREMLRSNTYDRDALFYLMKLHSDPTFDLETALSPFGFGPAIADYRMPWHIYMLLSRVLRRRDFSDRQDVGVEVLEQARYAGVDVDGNSACADNLTSNYAHQLELQGQWTWAAFVLLHLELPESRQAAIKALLSRNVDKFDDESRAFLAVRLKIPQTWLYETQAILARHREDRFREYELLIKAKLFVQAQNVAVRYLAPEAIIRGDLQMILSIFSPFLQAFPTGQLSSNLSGWTTGGQLYVDYVACVQRLPYLIASHEAGTLDSDGSEQLHRLAHRVVELQESVPTYLFPTASVKGATKDLGQVVARSDMLASLHNLARVLTIRKVLNTVDRRQGDNERSPMTWSREAGLPPEIEHVQNAANDLLDLIVQEA